jgi:hypothetical protein
MLSSEKSKNTAKEAKAYTPRSNTAVKHQHTEQGMTIPLLDTQVPTLQERVRKCIALAKATVLKLRRMASFMQDK